MAWGCLRGASRGLEGRGCLGPVALELLWESLGVSWGCLGAALGLPCRWHGAGMGGPLVSWGPYRCHTWVYVPWVHHVGLGGQRGALGGNGVFLEHLWCVSGAFMVWEIPSDGISWS